MQHLCSCTKTARSTAPLRRCVPPSAVRPHRHTFDPSSPNGRAFSCLCHRFIRLQIGEHVRNVTIPPEQIDSAESALARVRERLLTEANERAVGSVADDDRRQRIVHLVQELEEVRALCSRG